MWFPPYQFTPFLLTHRGFPCVSAGKESTCNAGDLGSIPGLRRSPGEGKGYPFQYSGLENFMDRGAWQATVHGVAKRVEHDLIEPLLNLQAFRTKMVLFKWTGTDLGLLIYLSLLSRWLGSRVHLPMQETQV